MKGKGTLYHFHPFQTNFDINQEITAESSPLHIASSRARTGTANHQATHP